MSKKFFKGLALGALVGSALGLFLNPTTGQRNREKFKKVSKQFSEKLIKDVAKMKTVGKKEYEVLVENVVKKHSGDKLLTKKAWEEIAKELKLRWKDVRKEFTKAGGKKK